MGAKHFCIPTEMMYRVKDAAWYAGYAQGFHEARLMYEEHFNKATKQVAMSAWEANENSLKASIPPNEKEFAEKPKGVTGEK